MVMAKTQAVRSLPKLTTEQMRYDSADAWIRWLEEEFPPPQGQVLPALNRLIKEGCSREVLVELMQHLSLSDCEKLSRDEIKAAEKALAAADEWVQKIATSDWMVFLPAVDCYQLGCMLSIVEDALRSARLKEEGGKRAFYVREDLIAKMVAHVKERTKTKKLHDKEVSLLIGVSLPFRVVKIRTGHGSPSRATSPPVKAVEYSLAAHIAWRRRKRGLHLIARETARERLQNEVADSLKET